MFRGFMFRGFTGFRGFRGFGPGVSDRTPSFEDGVFFL